MERSCQWWFSEGGTVWTTKTTGPRIRTAMGWPFLHFIGEMGKVGTARMASSQGTPAGRLTGCFPIRAERGRGFLA